MTLIDLGEKKMNPDELIAAFLNVIQEQDYVFNEKAIQDIPSLQEKLAALDNLSSESLAEVIRQWYLNHESVRDALLVTDREISKVKKANPAIQENTIENRYRIIKDELKKVADKKQQGNQQS
jgi:predicted RND superfamily exporter protein